MIRFFANARYDFIGLRKWAYLLSGAFVVPGLLLVLVTGVTYSIEFTGGALIQIETARPVGIGDLRTALVRGGLEGAQIQSFGSARAYVIRARLADENLDTGVEAVAQAVRTALDAGLGADRYAVVRTEAVGPKVGRELQQKALIAILFSFVTTLIYLAIRFEWRFGLAAVLATAHDILATIAVIRYLNLEISLVVVAAVLTVLGYSLNDTIVIFDRVRENLRSYRRQTLGRVLDVSINETLPRTVLTGSTALVMTVTLAVFAGEVIRPFALVLCFGIAVGTFSSIFIASPVLLAMEQRWPGTDARGARLLVEERGAEPPPTPSPARA
ncbi:MAG: protein translocase subunit SecF, partial [Gemmatimonadales bacterium]